MNVLIVSYESWRDTNNGGNVLSNIFSAFSDADIAQIYCYGDLPNNSVCQKYFQISDSMLLTDKKGRKLEQRDYSVDDIKHSEVADNKIKSKIPAVFKEALLLTREILWSISKWKTKELESFIKEFKPDIIFAPCYSYFHISKLALYAKSIARCPMISYISDDNYSLKQFRFSPSFWVNRLITRKWIRKHFSESSLIYTMTELQKKEYELLFKRPMKVLCKSALFEKCEKKTGNPVQFIYAGGLYLNRWKVLAELSKALADINKNRLNAQLHIFSDSELSNYKKKKINDGCNSILHKAIPYSELTDRYRESDVAVHVESFDIKNRLITRLSFSTKIIDCMNSGCAVLAIGPNTQAGISYLKDNDAAVCVNNLNDLRSTVSELVNHTEMIEQYAEKANRLGKKNHIKNDIDKNVRQDFLDIVSAASPQN